MIECPSCKAAVADGARFCGHCGQPISTVSQPSPRVSQGTPIPSEPPTSGLAIGAFVASLIPCFPVSLTGLILGIVSLSKIKARPREIGGKGFAIAAIVIGCVWGLIGGVGILAAIAIPNFIKYQARAKQSEARADLKAIYLMIEQEHATPADALAGVEARTRYTYYAGGAQKAPTLPGATPQPIPDELLSEAQADDVIAVAVANLDTDPALDVWSITRDGQLHHLQDDTRD